MNGQIITETAVLTANCNISVALPEQPFAVILIIHSQQMTLDWRNNCCDWLVELGQCRLAMAWGEQC